MVSNTDLVLYFKAMADETRLNILDMLNKKDLCGCDLLEGFDFTQPTLSYHMKILVDSGLVTSTKEGNHAFYSLNKEVFQEIKDKMCSFK